jgi:hypothetical protein
MNQFLSSQKIIFVVKTLNIFADVTVCRCDFSVA